MEEGAGGEEKRPTVCMRNTCTILGQAKLQHATPTIFSLMMCWRLNITRCRVITLVSFQVR